MLIGCINLWQRVRENRKSDAVLCKTRACVTAFSDLSQTVHYVGFTSLPPIPQSVHSMNYDVFLHVAGKSPMKNSVVVLAAWLAHPEWPPLIIVADLSENINWVEDATGLDLRTFVISRLEDIKSAGNILVKSHELPDDELHKLQTTSGVHICTSGAEGFGHYINEARAVGALVVTTNHAPMNELVDSESGILVEPTLIDRASILGLTKFAALTQSALEAAVEGILAMSPEQRRRLGVRSKERFHRETGAFAAAVANVFGQIDDRVAAEGEDILEEDQHEFRRFAYATMVVGGEDYIDGAIALAESIRRTSSAGAAMVCLVGYEVTSRGRVRLADAGWELVDLPSPGTPDRIVCPSNNSVAKLQHQISPRYGHVCSKLHLWGSPLAGKYDVVVYADADSMFLKRMDHLFDDTDAPVRFVPADHDEASALKILPRMFFQTALIVLKPSLITFDAMVAELAAVAAHETDIVSHDLAFFSHFWRDALARWEVGSKVANTCTASSWKLPLL